MKNRSPLRLMLLATAIPLGGVVAANAQVAQTGVGTTPSAQLKDVVVTAERKMENVQKTPAAVTVISGTKITQQGENNLEEIIRDVPGVNVTGQGQSGMDVNIRGQGSDLPAGSSQGAVATEFDGVYDLLYEGAEIGYYDVARVEVLPGPQGTLYGTNADGGVLNVIYNDPVLGKYHGSVAVNLGNYNLYHAEGMLNVPVSDVLAVRIAGEMTNRTSYYTPQTGDQVGQSIRAKVLYKPVDALTVRLNYELDHIGGMGPGGQVLPYVGGSVNNEKNPWSAEGFTDYGAQPSNDRQIYYQSTYYGNVSYNLDNPAVLTILPAYSRARNIQENCGANGAGAGQAPLPTAVGTCAKYYALYPFYQWSSEERLNSALGAKIEWDLGAYHWNYNQDSWGFGAGPPPGPNYRQIQGGASNAGFGEITYPVTSYLRLIGGIRDSFDRRFKNQGGATNAAGIPYETPIQSTNFHHFDYRAGLEYDLTPTSMEYFTAATGYRPGGFNVDPNGSLVVYKNEVITSYELGSKNRFLDNTLQVNGDVFMYNEKNYQLFDFYQSAKCAAEGAAANSDPTCQSQTLNLNGYVYGLEFQTRYNVTPDDQLSLSGSLLDAKFSNNQPANCAFNAPASGCYVGINAPNGTIVYDKVAGEEQPHAPIWSGNFGYNHTIDLASGATITAGLSIYFTGRYFVHPEEDPYALQPAYWTQDLSVNYTAAGGAWTINGYVHNLSNYAVKDSSTPFVSLGEPRTFGGTATYHF